MTLEVPEGALAAPRKDPADFAAELRLAAAAKWYEMRMITQARGRKLRGYRTAGLLRNWADSA